MTLDGSGLYKGVRPAHTEYTFSVPYAFYGSAQPDPVPNSQPAVWGLVLKDMVDRDAVGRERYGTPLQGFNGRDALRDAYEEALDLVVYLRQAIYERDNPPSCLGCGHLWSMHKDSKCTWSHGWTFVPCPCGESIPK